MPDDENTTDENTSDGSDADTTTTDETTGDNTLTDTSTSDNTASMVTENDPAKNKKLAELTMNEPIRDMMTFTITLPGIYKGMHTNQFLWMDVGDDFYDDFYSELLETVGENKFNRYTGFKEGRFYIQKKTWSYDLDDGVKTELELNPIPSIYSDYMKYQLEAEQLLDQSIIDLLKGSSGGTTTTTSGNYSGEDCDPNDKRNSNTWAGHKCKPPQCTTKSKEIHGNSSRQYAKDTASHNGSPQELVEYVKSQWRYQYYGDNPYGQEKCPEDLWTGSRPIRANCADSARLLKCILDVNGYNSIICHIPGHFYNAIWQNNDWTVCDLCNGNPYGHANHGNVKPSNTWDTPNDNAPKEG